MYLPSMDLQTVDFVFSDRVRKEGVVYLVLAKLEDGCTAMIVMSVNVVSSSVDIVPYPRESWPRML